MGDLLVDKDRWIAVDPSIKPMIMLEEDWEKLDKKAKITIQLCLRFGIVECIWGSYDEEFLGQTWDFVPI